VSIQTFYISRPIWMKYGIVTYRCYATVSLGKIDWRS